MPSPWKWTSRRARSTLLKYVAAHDCGRPINPMIVEGQIHGGLAQGIGTALGEELIYDDAGPAPHRHLHGLSRCRAPTDMPPLEIDHLDFPSPINELGIKGVGESGVVSPAAVIANAVEDALWDRGVRVTRVPLTPSRIFELLRATGRWPASATSPGPIDRSDRQGGAAMIERSTVRPHRPPAP